MTFRCFFPAWIAGWVVAIFLPSVFIAYFGLSPSAATIGSGFDRLAASSWKAADEIGHALPDECLHGSGNDGSHGKPDTTHSLTRIRSCFDGEPL